MGERQSRAATECGRGPASETTHPGPGAPEDTGASCSHAGSCREGQHSVAPAPTRADAHPSLET